MGSEAAKGWWVPESWGRIDGQFSVPTHQEFRDLMGLVEIS